MAKRQRPLPSIERVRAAMTEGRKGCRRKDGRYVIRIDGWLGLRSRIVWAVAYGEWPATEIDHINCDPSDDRLENLRIATSSENKANQRRKVSNRSGFKGVSWHRALQKWQVHIQANGKGRYLGVFADKESAHAAYVAAAAMEFGAFARSA